MKIFEVTEKVTSSERVRYNSEIAMLLAFTGGELKSFNPAAPEESIPAVSLANPQEVYEGIKRFLAPNFDPVLFEKWYARTLNYIPKIQNKMDVTPNQYTWAAGQNKADDAADIGFVGTLEAGVSVKDVGGITLSNLTPDAVGLGGGGDVIAKHAAPEFAHLKTVVFTEVMKLALASPDKLLSWHTKHQKYYITYSTEKKKFIVVGKGGGESVQTVELTQQEILSQVATNKDWQRPFGDWAVANWKNPVLQAAAQPLINKVAGDFEKIIETTLQDNAKLANLLRFAAKPYFYATTKNLFYVPTLATVNELKVKNVYFARPNGWTLKFLADIGREDSEQSARVEIHIRYANGMFACNPTVRVQSLKLPQFISWELL
jgi:hypothetical protein